MNDKSSLAKSHSKVSNFKLTLVCLIAIIAFALIFIGFSLYFSFDKNIIYLILGIIGCVLTALSALSFLFFKR